MDAAGVIAHYVMDGDQPLTADSGGNVTTFLYGLGPIGEKSNTWNFALPDGLNTPRQLTNAQGELTLSARYTPWGDSLEIHGTGNFTFGYLGGVLDATTGLLYVGNGQYYDPSTGRFLTRGVNPDSTNPYTPWNPIGAIVGPLGLISAFYSRKKKGGKGGIFLVLLLVLGSGGMTLAACGLPAGPATATLTSTPGAPVTYTATFSNDLRVTGTLPASAGAPTQILGVPCIKLPKPTYIFLFCGIGRTCGADHDLSPYYSWAESQGYEKRSFDYDTSKINVTKKAEDEIETIINQNGPNTSFVFIGHSAGADVAVLTANRPLAKVSLS